MYCGDYAWEACGGSGVEREPESRSLLSSPPAFIIIFSKCFLRMMAVKEFVPIGRGTGIAHVRGNWALISAANGQSALWLSFCITSTIWYSFGGSSLALLNLSRIQSLYKCRTKWCVGILDPGVKIYILWILVQAVCTEILWEPVPLKI